MKITFIEHSGFMVEMEHTVLLFDYYHGKIPTFDKNKMLYVFVSHSHADHYNPVIWELKEQYEKVQYIISDDVKTKENALRMKPHEKKQISEMTVETLKSNDIGVAYIVEVEGKVIYHAGDLNWWHWEGEEESFNLDQATRYQHEMQQLKKTLQGKSLDLAFIPMDQRLEQDFARGVICFCESVYAKHIVPIHFWNDFDALKTMMQSLQKQDFYDRIVPVAAKGLILEDNPKRG